MENVTNDEVFEMIDSRTGVLNANDWKSQLRRSATTQALKKRLQMLKSYCVMMRV
ncbi:pathogenicity island protein [Staphylococcus aureus]|nr:pathogenicity island protein [Staphylococcus aureus]